ncbi:MAG: sodium:solute symporter family transporter, partial [Longimicrobiales bacterium]
MRAHRFRRNILLTWGLLLAGATPSAGQGRAPERETLFEWAPLPALPEPLGVAGPCAGVSNGVLVVAGGAHFPTSLFEGGAKVWTHAIHVLEPVAERHRWHAPPPLPEARGYGASLSVDGRVLCIGGGNAERHFADVLSLEWRNGELSIGRSLPPLPYPLAFGAAALVGNTVYVAGGLSTPTSSTALKNFWALDLASPEKQWRELEAWPGPARYDAVAAAVDGAFYLFSGVELRPNPRDGLSHRFLRDAFRYIPERGWQRLADLPWPVAAAPSPAVPYGASHLLVFGGNDGSLVSRTLELRERHPGFRNEVLAYHTTTGTWTAIDTLPAAHVNTPAVQWGDRVVLASGEVRPGTRSPAIYAAVPIRPASAGFRIPDYLVLGAYFALLAGVGFYFAGRGKSDDDFFLSRGRIPAWAAGLSIFGTQLSAITFMAIPAKAYAEDWVYILGQASIILIAPVVVWLYLPFFRRLQVRTAYEYLERRFNLKVRLFGSLAFILLQLGRMAIVILLPAIALSTVAGFNIYLAILLIGVVTTLYSALGGIEAVVWTDVMQVIVLLG